MKQEREQFGSRLGFILLSAGCAIGLGNVWRFPYIAGEYGGAAFILIYLLFLLIFGIPIMTVEFAVGRGSGKSIAKSFNELEPEGTKWHWYSPIAIAGNYLLMMFYTVITGWMFIYFIKMLAGDFVGNSAQQISEQFTAMAGNPGLLIGFMVLSVVIGFGICSLGLKGGVEKISKVMMLALLAIIVILAIRVVMLPGASEGLRYYLVPDFGKMAEKGIGEVIMAAMGQAFFTLSIGMGSMAVFGSYISKKRRLMGESITIAILDTFVAIMAGLIVIPACFAFGIQPDAGPSLIFETLPNVFNAMAGGRFWGTCFFLFMIFAAMSTLIAVFENIISYSMDRWGMSRRKACLLNCILVILLSVPCALGFNLLSGFEPLGSGTTVLDLEDFIVSNNILPLGSLVYVLFATSKKYGWGWNNFLEEANTGKGTKFPKWLKVYVKYILPLIILFLWIQSYL
ncbi:MAG: sodium-dependent transporter [Clostridia bacterium]|nr:sodium-dependent transporter [Clostridia bacterium]